MGYVCDLVLWRADLTYLSLLGYSSDGTFKFRLGNRFNLSKERDFKCCVQLTG